MVDFDGALSADFLYKEKKEMKKSPVWLKNLSCTGSEISLFNCVHEGLGSHNCEGERRAGVLCRSKGWCNGQMNACPGGREVLPYKRLMGMCRWMGSHFQ